MTEIPTQFPEKLQIISVHRTLSVATACKTLLLLQCLLLQAVREAGK